MPPASPGNFYAATPTSSVSAPTSIARQAGAHWILPMPTRLLGAGGYNFVMSRQTSTPSSVPWTARALPSVVPLIRVPDDLADPDFRLSSRSIQPLLADERGEHLIARRGANLRVHIAEASTDPPAVLLPLDRLFDIRVAAALRLWRSLAGRNLGPNPATLSRARRDRLILALRALDGRLAKASYREIADALFGAGEISGRAWKSHDLRDRTIRLVHYGLKMMKDGYRLLLLHPYRGRS